MEVRFKHVTEAAYRWRTNTSTHLREAFDVTTQRCSQTLFPPVPEAPPCRNAILARRAPQMGTAAPLARPRPPSCPHRCHRVTPVDALSAGVFGEVSSSSAGPAAPPTSPAPPSCIHDGLDAGGSPPASWLTRCWTARSWTDVLQMARGLLRSLPASALWDVIVQMLLSESKSVGASGAALL